MDTTQFRQLPAVHKLLESAVVASWCDVYARTDVVRALQAALSQARAALREGSTLESWDQPAILRIAADVLTRQAQLHLRAVINATGIVLHTNLGRAPLAAEAIAAVQESAMGYSNLELDLETGQRGQRYDHVEKVICDLTGAEAALVVNNNAAAVFLILRELANGVPVAISRGELIEIGGSFRVSEIMRESGAQLVEVGTTNKTHERDYENALNEGVALVLRIHASNFKMLGFTYKPSLDALVKLAHARDVPVYEDLGSGSLFNLKKVGIGEEPTVRESIAAGVDVVSFSGDKLLGATQAGIICGKKRYLDRLKKNQLLRALRVDKLTLAALEATLRLYRDEEIARSRVPTLHMMTRAVDDLRDDANRLADTLRKSLAAQGKGVVADVRVTRVESQVGGGALPSEDLPSYGVALHVVGVSEQTLLERLRAQSPPIIARIMKEEVIFDVRTIFAWQRDELVRGIANACTGCA